LLSFVGLDFEMDPDYIGRANLLRFFLYKFAFVNNAARENQKYCWTFCSFHAQ